MLTALLIVVPAIILVLTILSRLFEGEEGIELDGDEYVIATAYRHWSVIFITCFLLGSAAFLFLAFAFYRAIGGGLVAASVAPPGNDFFNVLLWAFAALVGIMWLLRRRDRAKKKKKLSFWERALYVFLLGSLIFISVFRADGGRIFSITAGTAVGIDVFNALLIGVGLILIAFTVYKYFDLRDDSLVLTNFRVLRREVEEVPVIGAALSALLRRHVVIREFLQQMVIEDVQQVSVKQESYFEFYLYQFIRQLERFGIRGYKRYGTIVVQSLSFQTIRFEQASAPAEMQQQILGRSREVKRNETPDALLRRTLEEQVWGVKAAPPPPRFRRHAHQQTAGIFSWLFPPNPTFGNDAKRSVIWRPSWVFILWRMLPAFLTFFAIIVVTILLSRYTAVTGGLLYGLAVPAAIAALFWAWWVYDTFQHDLYILTEERIIDEDKAPFGPTNRREAELRSIQNVLFKETFIETILGYGDVIIRTGGAGGGDFTFDNLPNPREVQAQINAYVVDFRRRDQEATRRQTIQALTQYHVLQAQHKELVEKGLIDAMIEQQMTTFRQPNQPDESAIGQIVDLARSEARWSARRELRLMIRRFIRRQNRGGA